MKKNLSVFTKIFAYTMLLVLLISLAAVFLFARQFLSFYSAEQQRQLSQSYEPMLAALADRYKSIDEVLDMARTFARNNQSFNFSIQQGDGKVLFSTLYPADLEEDIPSQHLRIRFLSKTNDQGENQGGVIVFTGYSSGSGRIDYGDLIRRSFLALGLMLVIAISGAILFARKVTKPLEDEIIRERLMEENQRLFFSAASHELKTPVAAARALVEGMIAGVGDYKDHPKYLRECLKTLDAQAHLVSEILEIVKLSGEEAEPQAVILDLEELGNTVLAEYRPLAELRGLTIQGSFPRINVKADRGLLQRVLSNIIANAVQYTPETGTIRIETEDGKRLRILNTGASIPEDVLSKVFEPFFRLDTARTRHGSQSGLGLAIVKKALERMHINFGLENTQEAVLFWMELPVQDGTAATV